VRCVLMNRSINQNNLWHLGLSACKALYDHDLKHFGGLYADWDLQTREQMKDVWIKFQATVHAPLQRAWRDDRSVDCLNLPLFSTTSGVDDALYLAKLSERVRSSNRR
jgi:hypothetical protein